MAERTTTVQILAFDDMEVLDFAGPYEVFNVAGELSDPPAFEVHTVGATASPVGRGGFRVVPDFGMDDCPVADILVIPGGAGTRRIMSDQRILTWTRERAVDADLVLTVCTGALVAGAAGLLDGLDATTHHGAFGELEAIAPRTRVVRGVRFVRSSDRIYTSAGVSAGIDLALDVVAGIGGDALRGAVEAEMEWMWPDS
ncbi:MAG: two component transcriptional regulator, AraC family [Marmoricola sp.]|nr:two component transcriptional regulator, AraC family [Marmoricola sp.]